MYITNQCGKEIDYFAAAMLMDEDICEKLHMELAPCKEQEFWDAYCTRHLAKYWEDFEPDKANPVW